jgi:hypothetical protein
MNDGYGVSTLTWIAVAVDELAAFGAELKGLEPELDEKR